MPNVPAELKYTREHEWISLDGKIGTVGITDYAQNSLGDIVYVDAPKVGDAVTIVGPGARSRGLSSAVKSSAITSSEPTPTRISSGLASHVSAIARRRSVARGSG